MFTLRLDMPVGLAKCLLGLRPLKRSSGPNAFIAASFSTDRDLLNTATLLPWKFLEGLFWFSCSDPTWNLCNEYSMFCYLYMKKTFSGLLNCMGICSLYAYLWCISLEYVQLHLKEYWIKFLPLRCLAQMKDWVLKQAETTSFSCRN